jgi:DNA-binding transcriptional ArsR family regulator
LTKILLAVFLAFVITFSFAGLIQREKAEPLATGPLGKPSVSTVPSRTPYSLLTFPTFTYDPPAFSLPQTFYVTVNDRPDTLFGNSTREEIYDFIQANPGVQFRGICNELGLSIGLAEFHLGILKKAGLISFIRDGKYKRYFEAKRFSLKEMQLISLLRHGIVGSILKSILTKKTVPRCELVSQLSITSQGLTWQMNRLKKAGVVQENRDGMSIFYSLSEAHIPVLREIICLVEQP